MSEIINVKDQTFNGETIYLDGHNYVECEFKDCTFVYSATGSVGLVGCTFENPKFNLLGAAADTIEFIKLMDGFIRESGEPSAIQHLFGNAS